MPPKDGTLKFCSTTIFFGGSSSALSTDCRTLLIEICRTIDGRNAAERRQRKLLRYRYALRGEQVLGWRFEVIGNWIRDTYVEGPRISNNVQGSDNNRSSAGHLCKINPTAKWCNTLMDNHTKRQLGRNSPLYLFTAWSFSRNTFNESHSLSSKDRLLTSLFRLSSKVWKRRVCQTK
jgi:hypothetical protein